MNTVKILLVGLGVAALVGCATTTRHSSTHALVSETAGKLVPSDITPAIIHESDGLRVAYGRGTHPVEPGLRTMPVWPATAGPRSGTPIPGAHARAAGIEVEPLVLQVEPGARYYIGVRVLRHRTYARDGDSTEALGPWRKTMVPVVVRSTGTSGGRCREPQRNGSRDVQGRPLAAPVFWAVTDVVPVSCDRHALPSIELAFRADNGV